MGAGIATFEPMCSQLPDPARGAGGGGGRWRGGGAGAGGPLGGAWRAARAPAGGGCSPSGAARAGAGLLRTAGWLRAACRRLLQGCWLRPQLGADPGQARDGALHVVRSACAVAARRANIQRLGWPHPGPDRTRWHGVFTLAAGRAHLLASARAAKKRGLHTSATQCALRRWRGRLRGSRCSRGGCGAQAGARSDAECSSRLLRTRSGSARERAAHHAMHRMRVVDAGNSLLARQRLKRARGG